MELSLKEFEDKIDQFIDSPEGKAYFEKLNKAVQIVDNRYKRFELWLEKNDFEALMYRLILEHGEDYRENCYHHGYEPMPNNKLAFLIDYISDRFETVDVPEIDSDFNNRIWFFRGYYFQVISGQGMITRIYNKEDMKLVLVV
jgi:hypothetical protein